jgi:hypothetical protein
MNIICKLTRRHWWHEHDAGHAHRSERVISCRFCGPGHMGESRTYRCSNIGDPAPCTLERHHQVRGKHRHTTGEWVGGIPVSREAEASDG